MIPPSVARIPAAVQALVAAIAAVVAVFLWEGDKGFTLWDPGFLWYGAQRVVAGEVPIRDFMAYDPGRYYVAATIMRWLGDDGFMSLRVATAVVQVGGLFAALLLVLRHVRDHGAGTVGFLVLSAAVFATWMAPQHKLFDITVSICLVGALTLLIENPQPRRYLMAGIAVGLAAVFGRNHGVYGAFGALAAILWLRFTGTHAPRLATALPLWAAGVAIGFLPILLMAAWIPGFGEAFWQSITMLLELETTNLPKPIPWPWRIDAAGMPSGEALRNLLVGVFFIAILAFAVLAPLWAVRQRLRQREVAPVFAASACLALPYVHFAYSRADVSHLAQGIFPLLLGCLALFATRPVRTRTLFTVLFCAAGLWAARDIHPGWRCLGDPGCEEIEVAGDRLQVSPSTAADIALLRDLAERYAPNGESFIAAPFWPGAYALFARRAPVWEIYPLFPRSATFQRAEIARIVAAQPRFAIISDLPLGGRDELRYRNTHPLMYRYINMHFERIPYPDRPAYQLYRAHPAGP